MKCKIYYNYNLPIPEEVLVYLFRTRTLISIREINQNFKQNYIQQKRNKKKLSKVINIVPQSLQKT